MRLREICAAVIVVCATAPLASAQDVRTYIVGTYYRCNQATEQRADAIYKETIAPLVQKQVEAGRLVASGYARHWLGGEWRRLEYLGGTDLGAILDARQAIIEGLMGANAKAGDEFSAICPSHDDYIWSSVASSQAPGAVARERSKVAMSTYFDCSSREADADAIVKSDVAPVLNAHIKEGKIAFWNWLEHIAGGQYRRLLVIDGADTKSIVSYWSTFDEAIEAARPGAMKRFGEICHAHTDYVWQMGTE